jgi:hypothetical protein
MTEVLAPTMIDYAAPELAATMVPGCCGATRPGARDSPSRDTGSNLASLSCRAVRTGDGWQRHGPEGVDQPGPVRAALRAPHPDRHWSRPTRGSPPCSSTWTAPASRCGPSRPCTAPDEFCEVFFDDVVVPFDRTLGRRAGLGGGHGPPALRAQHVAVAPRRLPPPAAPGSPRHSPARRARPGHGWARSPSCSTPSGPAPGHPAPLAAGEHLGPETSIDKVLVATPSRRCSTWSPRHCRPR